MRYVPDKGFDQLLRRLVDEGLVREIRRGRRHYRAVLANGAVYPFANNSTGNRRALLNLEASLRRAARDPDSALGSTRCSR